MLITVLGVSGLGDLRGLPSHDDTALLRLVAAEPGTEHVLVLAPKHGAAAAREQAHVLVAADRRVHVCVLPLDHHALTLSLIAYELLSGPGSEGDPSVAVRRIQRNAARSRSLLWYPRLWGLAEPGATLGQAVTDLFRRTGWFLELGTEPTVVSGRAAPPFAPTDTVHHLPGAPALLQGQLGGARRIEVPVQVERAPYWASTSVELSVLDPADLPVQPLSPCPDCSAGLLEGQCPFCGHGPVSSTHVQAQYGARSTAGSPPSAAPPPPTGHRMFAPVGSADAVQTRGDVV